jgi:hypothetical protein
MRFHVADMGSVELSLSNGSFEVMQTMRDISYYLQRFEIIQSDCANGRITH